MSWSETAVASRPKSSSASMTMTTPATIVGARSGCSPRTVAALRVGQRGQALEDPPARGERTPRGRGRCRASNAPDLGLSRRATSPCPPRRWPRPRYGGPRLEPLPRRPSGRPRRVHAAHPASAGRREVALGVAHDARLRRDVEAHLVGAADDELGRAAADVDDERSASRRRSRARCVAPRKVSRASSSPPIDARVEPVVARARAR